ncbi:unnamed protein product [Clavelina lepadiformis]|uniref:Protein kinase domain-containing protein n=1 Tax=Clavelina lepadiformis TaxID=159417 RepID=A0ABP0FQ99_CLALP
MAYDTHENAKKYILADRCDRYTLRDLKSTQEWSNCIGIIMEYVETGNLDDFLWLQGDIADIPLLLQLRFAHQISDGLRYLHHHDKKRSYIHCDLKPENILLTPDLMVKIADFGSVTIILPRQQRFTAGSFTVTSTT